MQSTVFYLAVTGAAALALAYVRQFRDANLAVVRALSISTSETGVQDAVTPPWLSNLARGTYGLVIAIAVVSWFFDGVVGCVVAIALIFVGATIGRKSLPPTDSEHFKRLIFRSMSERYANYLRSGDTMRANTMKVLLSRAGIDTDADA
jgi:hypothetical protein